MVVYVDVLFVLNLLVNFLLLCGTARFAGRSASLPRLLAGAAIGGGYALAAALPRLQVLASWPGKLLSAALMLLAAFGWNRQLPRLGIWFALLSTAFAGVVLLLASLFGTGVYLVGGTAVYPISFAALVLTAGLCYGLCGVLLRRFGAHSAATDLKPVTVCIQGRKLRLTALLDNGNSLHDPVTGQSVFVLDAQAARSLLPQLRELDLERPDQTFARAAQLLPGARLVPYRAVGVSGGLLLAARSDWVLLGTKRLIGATVAFSPSPVSDGTYQVIAGGE